MKKILSTALLSSLMLCGIATANLNVEATELEQANSSTTVTESTYAAGPNLVSNPNFSKLDSQGYIVDWVKEAGPYTLKILPSQGYLALDNATYQGYRKRVESTKEVTLTGGVTYEVSVTSKGTSFLSPFYDLELNDYAHGIKFKHWIYNSTEGFKERKTNFTPGVTGKYNISFTNDTSAAPSVYVSNVSIAAK